MGMFDSLYVNCPKCKKQLEFQSKSGECLLSVYTKESLTPQVAIGMNGDIVKCKSCGNSFKLECEIGMNRDIVKCKSCGKELKLECQIPQKVKIKLVDVTNRRVK